MGLDRLLRRDSAMSEDGLRVLMNLHPIECFQKTYGLREETSHWYISQLEKRTSLISLYNK